MASVPNPHPKPTAPKAKFNIPEGPLTNFMMGGVSAAISKTIAAPIELG